MSSAAEALKRQLANTPRHNPEPVEDEFAKAIARKLESRGIAKVLGLADPEPEMAWYEKWIELDRQHKELEAEQEARHKAKQEAQNPPQTTAGALHAAIAGSSAAMPLNGASVLRAALGGGQGTINGDGQ